MKRWVSLLLLGSCTGSSGDSSPEAPPSLAAPVKITAHSASPLAPGLSLELDRPARLEVSQDGKTLLVATGKSFTDVPILGLLSDSTYKLNLRVVEDNGRETELHSLSYSTPPLPELFPEIEVLQNKANLREPGWTLFNTWSPGRASFLILLDEEGKVVWYYDSGGEFTFSDARLLPNGNLLALHDLRGALEITWSGTIVNHWWTANLDLHSPFPVSTWVFTDSFHHEISLLPEGEEADFFALGSEVRNYSHYPIDETNPGSTEESSNVVGDTIVEFRSDGTILREFSLLDLLDPYRLSYDSLAAFWNGAYPESGTRDWSHGNGVILDPRDNTYIVSLRNQDAVIKFRRDTRELVWILGDHGNWIWPWSQYLLEPAGDNFSWPYHTHAPALTSEGNLLLFDNGNARALPPHPPLAEENRFSRAVEYKIDEIGRRIELVWKYGGPEDPWYSPILGDADPLPQTGNILVTDGWRRGPGHQYGRLAEVTHTTPPEVVWEVHVTDSSPDPVSWGVYRAERIPAPYR